MRSLGETSSSSVTDDTGAQHQIEVNVLTSRNSLHSRTSSCSTSDANNLHSLESLQRASLASTTITRQRSSKIPLPTTTFAPSFSQSVTSAAQPSQIPIIPAYPRPYMTSTPAPKSHLKTARAVQVTGSKDLDVDDEVLTPTKSRADTMRTSPQGTTAAMSLPEFSDGNMTYLGKVPSQEFTSGGERCQEHLAGQCC